MTPDRKKPGVAFWATVAVVVVLAYPLSFGPVCWFRHSAKMRISVMPHVHWPLGWVMYNFGPLASKPMRW